MIFNIVFGIGIILSILGVHYPDRGGIVVAIFGALIAVMAIIFKFA